MIVEHYACAWMNFFKMSYIGEFIHDTSVYIVKVVLLRAHSKLSI